MPERHLLLDASVLVELVVDGRHRPHADRLLDQIAEDPDLVLVTAAHGLIEAASALRRLVHQTVLTVEDGSRALLALRQLDLVLDATSPRLARMWELRERMSTYDAAYAAAAAALDLPLLTVDARLHRACADAGIPARHLRDLPG